MKNAEIPVSAAGNNGAAETATVRNGSIQIVLNLEDVPRRVKFASGETVEGKAFLDLATLRKIPFITNEDYASLDEALADAGDGASGHTVNFKWRSSSTYKMLRQYGHDNEPKGSKVRYPAPCLFGDWTVSVRGLQASSWESSNGNSGVKFTLVGLRPEYADDYDESIPWDALEVVDRTGDED